MLARATEPCTLQGTYGSIRYAFDDNGVRLAVKMQHGAKTASEREVMLESAMNEANAYSLLHRAAGAADQLCPEILWLKYVAFMAPSKIALAFEAWPMDLCKLLHRTPDLDLAQRLHLALDIAKGLRHMHNLHPHPLLHGDIKYDNVLVKMERGRWRACIMDLGLAKVLDPRHTIVRSMHPGDARCSYMPNDAILSPAFDMFSFGMLAACVFLDDFGMYTIKNAVKCIHDRLREKGLRRRLAEQMAPEAVDDLLDMVKRCLHDQPTHRPPAKEVVATLGELLARVSNRTSMTPTTPPTGHQRALNPKP
jgi:serine/threonine protein kinase